MKYIMFLVCCFHTTTLYYDPSGPLSISPTEKRQIIAANQQMNVASETKKNMNGTPIILMFLLTNSDAASSTAIEICKLLHIQSNPNT
jgi:hypothetical protein